MRSLLTLTLSIGTVFAASQTVSADTIAADLSKINPAHSSSMTHGTAAVSDVEDGLERIGTPKYGTAEHSMQIHNINQKGVAGMRVGSCTPTACH